MTLPSGCGPKVYPLLWRAAYAAFAHMVVVDLDDRVVASSASGIDGRSPSSARAAASLDSRSAAPGFDSRRRPQGRPGSRRTDLSGSNVLFRNGHGELTGRRELFIGVGRLPRVKPSARRARGKSLPLRAGALVGGKRPANSRIGPIASRRSHPLPPFADRRRAGGDHWKKDQQLSRFRNLLQHGSESSLRSGLVSPEVEGVLRDPPGARRGLFSCDSQPRKRARRNP
ncbi:hypothetical protein MAMC_01947 [Methylacidimicrobium cyclopophantes]|uniref:Uncharacterized protein n=1 Tax=Methylacidimicrobium cyclopophantes TaxID=1041766 RepID=A0A5E6MEX8_9BACT|nr:hypothetical protein MAMC_01947 [Methylacidimicrobium cyclopophantes]